MKTTMFLLIAAAVLSGCGAFRLPATEAQKENAWLHRQTTQLAAEQAQKEAASPELQGLTALAHQQSMAFVIDAGLPRQTPDAPDVKALFAAAPATAAQAAEDAARRFDPWDAADGLLEAAIAVAGLVGGAWGLRAAQWIRTAREKAQALREIVEGNELFKQTNREAADAFREAHRSQSPATQRLVTELRKAG